MDYYKATGNSGCTYAVHTEDGTFTQIEFPTGELGTVQKLEEFENWNLGRWKAQFDVEQVSKEELPDALLETVE